MSLLKDHAHLASKEPRNSEIDELIAKLPPECFVSVPGARFSYEEKVTNGNKK